MKCDELKPLIFSIADLAYVDEIRVTKNFQNPHDHAVYKATEVDAAIEEFKAKLESVKATAYTESVDAGMENRKLKRALWLARAERAASWQIHFSLCHNNSIEREFSINGASMPCEGMVTMRTARDWSMIWKKVASKCRAKAEQYK